jgi:HEAT repeat protein/tetratricopeptide (TPR) repeat protein
MHRSLKTLWVLCVACALTLTTAALDLDAACAQDWGASANDRDAAMAQRYRQLADRSDEETYAFKQLMKVVGSGGPAYEKLVADYEAKAVEEPQNPRWLMLLGHTLRNGGRFEQAVAAYENAVALKESSLAFESIGDAQAQRKLFDDASAAYDKALALSSNKEQRERVLRALGKLSLDRRQFDKALTYFEQLVALDPTNLFIRKELALLLADNRRFDDAQAQLEAALKLISNKQDRAQITLDIGDILERAGRFDDALSSYRDAAKLSSDTWTQTEVEERVIGLYRKQNNIAGLLSFYKETWRSPSFDQLMILARLSEEVGLTPDALAFVKRAIQAKPSNIDAHLKLIQITEQTGDANALSLAYEQLLKAAPREVRFRFEYANFLERTQRRPQAIKALEQTAAAFPKDIDILTRVADAFIGWGLLDRAVTIYKTLTKLEPQEPIHLEGLGELYYTQGQQALALSTWQKTLTVITPPAEAHMVLGRIYVDHGMVDLGLEEYRHAQTLIGDDPTLSRDLAEALESAGRVEDARQTWERLALSAPDPLLKQEARGRLIAILKRTGMLRAASRDYQAQLSASPPNLDAGLLLASAQANLDDLPAATATLQKLLEIDPNHLDALSSIEKLYAQQGLLEQAIATLQTLSTLDPRRARIYNPRIIDLYLDLGDTESAETWIKKAIGVGGNDAPSLAKLGDIYLRRLDYTLAAETYEQSIEADPLDYQNYFTLAEIYGRLHRDGDADQLLRKVVRSSPDQPLILKASRRLIDHHAARHTLASLEADFIPLLNILPARAAYREALIDLYQTMTLPLIARARAGASADRAVAQAQLQDIGRRALKPLTSALSSVDSQRKVTVVQLLGELSNPSAAPPLSDLLASESGTLRITAALSLGKLASPASIPALNAALAAAAGPAATPTMRELSAWALGRISDPAAAAALTALTSDSSGAVRALAALGLGRHGLGADPLLKMYSRERIPDLQRAITWALGQSHDPRALQPLIQTLSTSSSAPLAATAAWALGGVPDPAAARALFDALWAHPSPEVRAAAALGLARLSSPASLPPTFSLWEDSLAFIDPNQDGALIKVDALIAELAHSGQRDAQTDLNALLSLYKAPLQEALRAHVTSAQGDDLARLLADLDADTASLSLSPTSPPGPPLTAASAADLAALGRAALSPLLPDLLRHPSPAVRWHAASLIGKLLDVSAVDPLITALADPEPEVQRQAALSLGRLKDPRSLDPLTKALQSPDFGTRAQSAWALGLLGDAASLDPLTKALNDPSPFVQAFAAKGLGLLGDPRAVAPLSQRISGADQATLLEVIDALAALKDPSSLQPLLQHPDLSVRQAAQRALSAPSP